MLPCGCIVEHGQCKTNTDREGQNQRGQKRTATTTIPATSIGGEDISPSRANYFFEALNAEIRIRRRELTALEGARDALLAGARRSEPADVLEPGPSEPGG